MEGTKIGSYRLTRKLGEGGMGAVYLAESEGISTKKAVKVLLGGLVADPSMMARFRNEAQAVADLEHDNIIGIDEFAQLPNGQWFIMMPFLEGAPLSSFLASHGPLGVHLALHILAQVGAALHAAHARGFVHRDLKPENIFITSRHSNPHLVKLLDFGIAKNTRTTPTGARTQNGAVMGTPVYMAAEQYEDAGRVDARADLFSLGVIAYVMLSGRYPFGPPTENWMALYNRQRYEAPAPLPETVPDRVQQVIFSALAYDPASRPQSAQAFVVELALGTPDDPMEPSGVEIVRRVASELLTSGPYVETTKNPYAAEPARAPWPRLGATPSPAGVTGERAAIPVAIDPPTAPPTAGARPGAAGRAAAYTDPPYLRATATVPPTGAVSRVPDAYPAITPDTPLTTLSAASGPIASSTPAAAPRKRARFVIAAIGSGMVVLATIVIVASMNRGESNPPVAAAVTVDGRPAAVTSQALPPLPITVDAPTDTGVAPAPRSITIDTVPPGADLIVDGKPAGVAPTTIDRPLGASISVRARRSGYQTLTESVTVSDDTERIELRLVAKSKAHDSRTSPPVPTRPPPDAAPRRPGFDPDDVVGN